MIVKQALINKIKDYFDLNIYETKVWLALLSKGLASAGEIAEISGVPRSRTYDVLESLEKSGFAIVKLGKPVKYLVVKPNIILDKMRNNVMKDAEERISSLGKIKDTAEYQGLEDLYNEGVKPIKREDISASLKGRSNIVNHTKEILLNAEKEIIICLEAKELISRIRIFQQVFEKLKTTKVKVRVALSGDEKVIEQLAKKLDIKISKINIKAKFFIVDRKEIIIHTSDNPSIDENAIWLSSEFFANAFATLFDKAVKN